MLETIRVKSEELEAIGDNLIADLSPNLTNANIEWIMETRQYQDTAKPAVTKTGEKMGSAKKAGPIDRMLHRWDFRITISGNWWAVLSDEQKKALVYHELCHCYMKDGKPTLVKHEFEGFLSELRHCGAWAADLKAVQEILAPQLKLVEDEEVPVAGADYPRQQETVENSATIDFGTG